MLFLWLFKMCILVGDFLHSSVLIMKIKALQHPTMFSFEIYIAVNSYNNSVILIFYSTCDGDIVVFLNSDMETSPTAVL